MNLTPKVVILVTLICFLSILVCSISVFFSLRKHEDKPELYVAVAVAPMTPVTPTTTPATPATQTITSATPTTQAPRQHVDYGVPLFLTPLIEAGQIDKARELAAVSGYFSWVDSFAGFLTVNEQRKSNLFFWYFPLQSPADNHNAPAILWLQGTLGVSSLIGLFCENGPFILDPPDTIHRRKSSWTDSHHLIYIDSPVGTGYSFAEDDDSPRTSKEIVHDLYEAVKQIFTMFPKLQKSEFYVAGEHFGGKYAISLAHKIASDMKKYKTRGTKPKVPIHLAGVVVGNGFVDPIHQINYADFLNGIGMIDNMDYSNIKAIEKHLLDCIKNHTSQCAYNQLVELTEAMKRSTGFPSLHNYVEPAELSCLKEAETFIHSPKVRKALHVGYLERKAESSTGAGLVSGDYMESVSVFLSYLLEEHRVCIYSGQLNMLVPHASTSQYLERLKIPNDPIFRNAPRHVWRFGDDLAGYLKRGVHLYEVLVRNAGHMAAADQPDWMKELITNFTHRRGFFED